jgi:predicted transcriptional regulator
MNARRHSPAEIAAKLEQAEAMSNEGRRHQDIAKLLGVSVMTYHRWRKARASARASAKAAVKSWHDHADMNGSATDQTKRINALRIENSRLRQLVTDLLLEKMSLEERAHGRTDDRRAGER